MSRRIAILGAGESGVGCAILAQKEGYDVFVSDYGPIMPDYEKMLEMNAISYEANQHSEEKILNADIVMKSPGIPEKAEIIKKIRDKNIPVISELEFAYPYAKGKIIGITGSNGKTTTTHLLYHIFQTAGYKVGMAGNVGISFALMVAKDPKDIYIIEISSFQLDDIKDFKNDVAILLNITPDHLDRYEYKMENYVRSKFKITNHHTERDLFIYCADDEETMKYFEANKHHIKSKHIPFSIKKHLPVGGYISDNNLIIHTNQTPFKMLTQELTIKGKHNQYNSLAAGIAAKSFDIKDEVLREAFRTFHSIPHRMESVLNIQGVEYINDSKATNVNSTWYALESMEKKVVWIVGGVDKGNDYSVLIPLIKKKVKAIVCLGLDNIKIHNEFSGIVDIMISTDNMKDAVKSASRLAEKGEAVLLSPCCASFDLFKNYEDRGDQFKECVRGL
jgi:UDP-N-acetylmuramoylalanine--D-glutamate ligase